MQLLNIFKQQKHPSGFFLDDRHFNRLYPYGVRALSARHWTPVKIALSAAEFLGGENGSKILDIGSGVGKFCLCAAHTKPNCLFFGIEQRAHLVQCAERTKRKLALGNAFFIHSNMTAVDFTDYNHFYFFNSFYEHLEPDIKIDRAIHHSTTFYEYYTECLYEKLATLRRGTRLCTYFGRTSQVPESYRLIDSLYDEKLKLWIKS